MKNSMVDLLGGGALILDCDGTIAPKVEAAHGECVARVFQKLSNKAGVSFSRNYFDTVWEQELGRGILNFAQKYVESLDEDSAKAVMAEIGTCEAAEGLYEEEYIAFSQDPANKNYYDIRKGLKEVFEAAVANKLPIGVISNANQQVLEATLTATLHYAGFPEGDLNQVFTAIVGKDTVIRNGYLPKPNAGAIICLKEKLNEAVSRPISLANSIGWGDTPSDYAAFKHSGILRIVACENEKHLGPSIAAPDADGFVKVGIDHDVSVIPDLYRNNPLSIHHGPHLPANL